MYTEYSNKSTIKTVNKNEVKTVNIKTIVEYKTLENLEKTGAEDLLNYYFKK